MTDTTVYATRSPGGAPHLTFDPPAAWTAGPAATIHRVHLPAGCAWDGVGRLRRLLRPGGWPLGAYAVFTLARLGLCGFSLAVGATSAL